MYLSDDVTQYIYFVPASQLRRFAGDLLVGTEVKAHFYVIKPNGTGFTVLKLRHNLRGGHFSLEGATYVG